MDGPPVLGPDAYIWLPGGGGGWPVIAAHSKNLWAFRSSLPQINPIVVTRYITYVTSF